MKHETHAALFELVRDELVRLQELADSDSESVQAGNARATIAAFALMLAAAGVLPTLANVGANLFEKYQAQT